MLNQCDFILFCLSGLPLYCLDLPNYFTPQYYVPIKKRFWMNLPGTKILLHLISLQELLFYNWQLENFPPYISNIMMSWNRSFVVVFNCFDIFNLLEFRVNVKGVTFLSVIFCYTTFQTSIVERYKRFFNKVSL